MKAWSSDVSILINNHKLVFYNKAKYTCFILESSASLSSFYWRWWWHIQIFFSDLNESALFNNIPEIYKSYSHRIFQKNNQILAPHWTTQNSDCIFQSINLELFLTSKYLLSWLKRACSVSQLYQSQIFFSWVPAHVFSCILLVYAVGLDYF